MTSSTVISAPIRYVIQDDGYKHVYRRTAQLDFIFERPQRLRFVNLGLAIALAWVQKSSDDDGDSIQFDSNPLVVSPRLIVTRSQHRISTDDPAVLRIHPTAQGLIASSSSSSAEPLNVDPTNYLDHLVGLCHRAAQQHQLGLSEVPDHLPQGDLYLSAGTELAILGAISACYDAVNFILGPTSSSTPIGTQPERSTKAFVNIRPPGHHCTNTEPMGFCWINNVLVSCMYSHLKYGIDRICILDIDLHHGNGSQQIVWAINEQAQEHASTSAGNTPGSQTRKLQISYSSLHDLNSYPCEDGDPDRIKDACLNVCLAHSVNQFIQNLHLEPWVDETDFFDRLYPSIWAKFETHMLTFFKLTHASTDRTLIFVSAGFDACEHETDSMSRYGMKLPTAFYHRFALDLGLFANQHTSGRVISVLEGGYSETTLVASSLSYLLGLIASEAGYEKKQGEDDPWALERLQRASNLVLRNQSVEPEFEAELIQQARKIFTHIDGFDRAKVEMKAEARKVARAKISVNPLGSGQPPGMRLRSGRTASLKVHQEQNDQAISHSSIESMFEKLAIGATADTPATVPLVAQSATKETKNSSGTPATGPNIDTPVTSSPIAPSGPEEQKESTDVKPQRLKLVWKSEGIDG